MTVANDSVTGRPPADHGTSSTEAASGSSPSGSVSTRKSSPPMCPTRADPAALCDSARPTARISSSPAANPAPSLTCLK